LNIRDDIGLATGECASHFHLYRLVFSLHPPLPVFLLISKLPWRSPIYTSSSTSLSAHSTSERDFPDSFRR